MTLFDYYLRYMTEVWEGTRPAPEGITLPEGGDENARIQALGQQLQDMGMAAFVRACAAQDGTVLPEELFAESGDLGGFELFLQNADKAQEAPAAEKKSATPDPDANKHAFEVFLDCIAMDDGLVQYLIDVLKRMDRKEFSSSARSLPSWTWTRRSSSTGWAVGRRMPTRRSRAVPPLWTTPCCGLRMRDGWMWWPPCSAATEIPSRPFAARHRSLCTHPSPPSSGTRKTIWIGTIPSDSLCA